MDKQYSGWLVSNSILKRSAAVYGHMIVFVVVFVWLPLLACVVLASVLNG